MFCSLCCGYVLYSPCPGCAPGAPDLCEVCGHPVTYEDPHRDCDPSALERYEDDEDNTPKEGHYRRRGL